MTAKDIMCPLDKLNKIAPWEDEAAFQPPATRPGWFVLNKDGMPTRFFHGAFVDWLMENYGVTCINGTPAIWDGSCWRLGQEGFDSTVDLHHTNGTETDCKNVFTTVTRRLKRYGINNSSDVRCIQFPNGVLNIEKYREKPDDKDYNFSAAEPESYITNELPHPWNPDAYSPIFDKFLDDISCGRPDVRANLEELMGLCIYRDAGLSQQFSYLAGSGSNGKGVYCTHLRRMLGADNYTSLSVRKLSGFMQYTTAGKLAVFDDDVSAEFLTPDTLSELKKLVGGDEVASEIKHQAKPLMHKPYFTLVMSVNSIPRISGDDANDGYDRRAHFIPFDAKFVRGTEGFDPFIGEKLDNEECYQYSLKLAVDGLVRMLDSGGLFTVSSRSAEIKREHQLENNTCAAWADEYKITAQQLVDGYIGKYETRGNSPKHLHPYLVYCHWCEQNRVTATSKAKWYRKMQRLYPEIKRSESRRDYKEMGGIQYLFEFKDNGGDTDASNS